MKHVAQFAVVAVIICSCWLCIQSELMPQAEGQEKRGSLNDRPKANANLVTVSKCRINPIQSAKLASAVPGILDFVEPGEGDLVRAGAEVARLQDGVPRAQLSIAKRKATNDINVRFQKKALELANKELQYRESTNRDVPGTVPLIEIEQFRLASKKSELAIEQADEELELNRMYQIEAEEQLKTYSIKAGFDGLVTRIYKEKGEAVRQGDPILEIVNTGRVRVEGYVNIRHAWSVQPGDLVVVQLDIPGLELPVEAEKFEGRIEYVAPDVTASNEVRVWAEVPNRLGKLKTGLTATMLIRTRHQVARRPGN